MPFIADRWTAERVCALPDDGNRYELVSGELVVTPAPSGRHHLVERWRPEESRPEIVSGDLTWRPAAAGDLVIDLPSWFTVVCGVTGNPPSTAGGE